jgi:hypothetical protein
MCTSQQQLFGTLDLVANLNGLYKIILRGECKEEMQARELFPLRAGSETVQHLDSTL